jgi:photosystem II oxygen-evolving enhancer protein 1
MAMLSASAPAALKGVQAKRVSLRKPVRVAASAGLKENVAAAGVAAALSLSVASGAQALTYDEIKGLTYSQVRGSGLANTCPELVTGTDKLDLGKYKGFKEMCLEPSSVVVEADLGAGKAYQPSKLMTRNTYSLAQLTGTLSGGQWKEQEGIDFAPTTVKLRNGELVPFLFTFKEASLSGPSTLKAGSEIKGEFVVPSYRGQTFLDPKGRGYATGYQEAVALQALGEGQEELEGENFKSVDPLKGAVTMQVATVNEETGEIAGVFESIQPSDTDLGSKKPKNVKIQGVWYAQGAN